MDFDKEDIKQAETIHLQDGDMSRMMEHELTAPRAFFINCALSCCAALLVGSIIDNIVRKIQGDKNQNREDALLFLALQVALNISFLFAMSHIKFVFVPWLQLTLSGLLWSVLFFAVQDNLLQNTLRATRF